MNLTQTSLKRPVTTAMIFLCMVVIGIIASRIIPLEFFPDVDWPFVGVDIPYPGSTPEEVERQITRTAEEVLATISDVKRMTSESHEGGAYIGMEFDWGVDTELKALEVKEKMDGIRHLLPDDLERYYVRKWSSSDMEIMVLRVSSKRDLSNAYDMLDRNVKRRLERLPGVSRVALYGVEKKEISIKLDADRVIAHHIDLTRLVQTLRESHFQITAGKITDGNNRLVVRPLGEFTSMDEIGELVVGDHFLKLKEIASIEYDYPEKHEGRHLDRRYAIGLDVYKESGANTVDVCRAVIKEVDAIAKIPEMEGISIYYMDDLGEGIISSLNELLKSGFLGALLAVLVLLFFMRRLGTTLIVTLAVPFSILITIAFMYFIGISMNILSMMGLLLAVGMLVDNAVVVTESIHRYQLENPKKTDAIRQGVSEVALAITAGTITTGIVFLPNIVSVGNEITLYLRHVGIALCIALLTSLILAQTIVPLLISRTKLPTPHKNKTIIDKTIDRYSWVLKWTMHHRWVTIGIIFAVLLSIAFPMSQVKQNMFDEPDDRRFRLHYHIKGSYLLEKVEATVDVYEDYLFAHQDEFEIESIYSYYTNNYASSTILLTKGKAAKKSMKEIQELIRKELPRVPLADPSFEWEGSGAQGESVRIQLMGKSSEQLVKLAEEIIWILEQIPGLQDVRSEAEAGEEEVRVVVDRMRARQYGFSPMEVANVITAAMRGINLRRFRNETGEVEMHLEFQDQDRQTLDQLQNLPLYNGGDHAIKLAALADFSVQRGPRRISRENRTTSLGITSNMNEISVIQAKERIGKVMANYHFPPGYTWSYGQRFDYEAEALQSMLLNLLMALALIYFVMAALFESLIFPAAIWTQILFAVVGVYWFFFLTGTTMSIMGMIGILILIGVVVNNGIVLIDHVNRLREMGKNRNDAIVQAGRERLRPILMTAGTTVLSLVPLCIATTQIGGNGPPYFPLARAIVGGLAFSTMVTLLILPTIYILLDDLRSWSRHIIRKAV